MNPKDVQRPDDILSAADAMLKSRPIEPITKREDGTPPARAQDPGHATLEGTPEDPAAAPEGEPDVEGDPAVDGDPTADPLAERERSLSEKEAQVAKRIADAEANFRKILENPDEYSKTRRELGLEPAPAPTPAQPAGPDPIENPDAWRYRRLQMYQRENVRANAGWTPDAMQEGVERDLIEARDRLYHDRLAKMEQRFTQREQQEQAAAAGARAAQEQAALERQMEPVLRAAYPNGVPPDAKEDIDAHLALARARGQQPDIAAIVAKVSGRAKTQISRYVQNKRALSAGAGASRSQGGQSPAPVSIVKKLPATLDSITKLGDMLAEGQLKR
jgi:hypothetical protein